MGLSPDATLSLGYNSSSSSWDPFTSINNMFSVPSSGTNPSSLSLDTGSSPFFSTSGISSPLASSSSSGGFFSDIGSALSGAGNLVGNVLAGESALTLAGKGLTPASSVAAAQGATTASIFSGVMPILLIGGLIVGGVILFAYMKK